MADPTTGIRRLQEFLNLAGTVFSSASGPVVDSPAQDSSDRTDRLRSFLVDAAARLRRIAEDPAEVRRFAERLLGLIARMQALREQGLWRKTHFNLFAVIRHQYIEDTHSNLLAWLLDPGEAHGLGDFFLSEFIRLAYPDKAKPVCRGVRVKREAQTGGDRPDIVCEAPGFTLVVENKISSGEGPAQTTRYALRYGDRARTGRELFLVYLTPGGAVPEHDGFRPVSYRQLVPVLERAAALAAEPARYLLTHLIEHVGMDLEG